MTAALLTPLLDLYGSHIVLIDTSGFDDTKRTDVQILELIGKWAGENIRRIRSLEPILS